MPTPTCAKCRRTIPGDDINVAQDVAYCRDCNISYSLSELTSDDEFTAVVELRDPPEGAWFVSDGSSAVIGATNRNLVNGVGFLFFALFWNGLLSVFVVFAIAGTLHHLHVPLPGWFPMPKMEGGGEMDVGMTVFLWLFLTPFIGIGLIVAGAVLSSFFGRTEVRIANSQAIIFNGIGAVGWKRRFDCSQIKSVKQHRSHNSEGSDTLTILMETRAGKQIKFGSMLSSERRQFILAALRQTVLR